MRHMTHPAVVLSCLAVLLLSGCSSDDDDASLGFGNSPPVPDAEVPGLTDGDTGDTTGTGDTTTGDTGDTGTDATGGDTGGDTTGTDGTPIVSYPEVLSLTTTSGPAAGGTTTVVLTLGFATDFRDTLPTVTFAGGNATGVEAISRGVVKVVTPANPVGLAEVTVSVPGEEATLSAAFDYQDGALENYLLVEVEGAVEADGVPVSIPLKITRVGNVQPAALLVDLSVDLLNLPVAGPTALDGDVAANAGKELHIKEKNDGLRLLVLGKNRNVLGDGTVVTLIYNLPPTEPWSLSPLHVSAKAVDPFGKEIPVVTQSGWLGIDEGSP
jgi:hypothetical protein